MTTHHEDQEDRDTAGEKGQNPRHTLAVPEGLQSSKDPLHPVPCSSPRPCFVSKASSPVQGGKPSLADEKQKGSYNGRLLRHSLGSDS